MRILAVTLIALWSGATGAMAQQITSMAVSPDGSTLMVAGDNRALYRVDARTMTVTDRRYAPGQVRKLAWSADGDTIFALGRDGRFGAHSAGSFKEQWTARKIIDFAYAPEADQIALIGTNFKDGVLDMRSAGSGKSVAHLEFPEAPAYRGAIAPDGTRAVILTRALRSDSEPRENAPADLKGYARAEFRQMHDGYTSKLLLVDLTTQEAREVETFFRANSPRQMTMIGDKTHVMSGNADSAVFDAEGNGQLIDLGEDFVSGVQLLPDGKTLLTSNGLKLALRTLDGSKVSESATALQAERMPGPGEMVTAMTVAADGTIWLGTNAYRLLRIGPERNGVEAAPIY